MASKQNICYRILKHHGVLIAYSGTSLGDVTKKKKKDETFGQWKKRVLGANAGDVTVFAPVEPAPQTRFLTLRNNGAGEHAKKIFEAFGRFKDRKTDEALSASKEEIYEQYSTIPKETLRSVFSSFDGNLEPSLNEYFTRLLESKRDDIDAEDLFKELINDYNIAVKSFRELKPGK